MDSNKIKDMAIRHVEKVVLGIFVCVSGFLVYQAMQLPDFTKQPTRLRDDANRVKNEVDDDHTDEIIPLRELSNFDILTRTKKTLEAVDPVPTYDLAEWQEIPRNDAFKRRDPQLYAPLALKMSGVIGTMAIRSKDGQYELAELEPADPVVVVEEKKTRPKRKPRRSRRGGDPSMEGMGMEGMGMEDMGLGGEMAGMMDGAEGGMMDMMGGMTPAGPPVRRLDPQDNMSIYQVPASLSDFKTGAPMKAAPMVARFIAGTAVIPHKAIYNAFRTALADSTNYRPQDRDTPKYWNFQVQRADVTDRPVDQIAEGDWVVRKDRVFHTQVAAVVWAGTAPELVPSDYRDDLLTMWIPPMLLDDYSNFVLHPMIPMISKLELELQNKPILETVNPFERINEDGTFKGIDINRTDVNLNATTGNPMMPGMRDMEGMATSSSPYGFAGVEANPVEHKLIRFYDFDYSFDKDSPKPGRKYVYRIRVSVKDPNFPDNPLLQPLAKTLHPESYERVSALQAKAEKDYAPVRARGGRDPISKFRQFERWTPWSEPSDPVSLPTENTVLAGPVVPAAVKTMKWQGRNVPFAKNEPTGKMVVSKFDTALKTRVPMQIEATEGTVLSKTADSADVIDPLTLEIKKLPKAKITNRTTVIALEGGNPLQIVTNDEMKEPGQYLLFKDNGELDVSDEIDDMQQYRIYSFAEERGE
ncbi:hypothetical protein Pla52o_40750 [Novipirellula galeiformis]|uniref:Uncharacterized protein n=1 Tax=Novipirellula galeiformis TaxID=2528004 RepID=A0A5C6C8M4_9BACT|nr:hypothetical protein [Novipirellula galeiformis]TWU21043.1 hypothetical protein Pla52o_40750 [Novipirellula galeiformis]